MIIHLFYPVAVVPCLYKLIVDDNDKLSVNRSELESVILAVVVAIIFIMLKRFAE